MTDFNTFDISEICLASDDKISDFLEVLFFNFFEKVGINKATYYNFIDAIKQKYINNPYHNFNHVVDATNTLCYIIDNLTSDAAQTLSHIDRIILITAMLCHDLGHFGKTGKYVQDYCLPPTADMVTANIVPNEFLRIYDNYTFSSVSPLEEFHWYLTVEIIKSVGLFDIFDDVEQTKIFSTMKEIILATDPATLGDVLSTNNFEYKLLIKSADIGTCLKQFSVHKKWANNLIEEFKQQGDIMKVQNILVPSVFDRSDTNIVIGQLWFFDNYTKPLYAKLSNFVNHACLAQLIVNYETWKIVETD